MKIDLTSMYSKINLTNRLYTGNQPTLSVSGLYLAQRVLGVAIDETI